MKRFYPAAFILCILFLHIALCSYPQDDIKTKDSLFGILTTSKNDTGKTLALLHYGGLYAYTVPDSSEYYYRKAAALAKRINYYRGYEIYISYQTEIYNIAGKFDSSILLCREGLQMAQQRNDDYFEAVQLSNTGNAFLYQSNNDSAAFYLIEGAKHFEKIKDSLHLGTVLSNLSIVFSNMGQLRRAMDYDKQSLIIAENMHDEIGVGYACSNLGADYLKLHIYDTSKYYALRSVAIAKKNGDFSLEKDATINLGLLENNSKNFRKAIEHFSNSLKISRQLESNQGVVASYAGMANSLLQLKDYDSSLLILNSALPLALSGNFNEELKDVYNLQFQSYRALNKNDLALEANINYTRIKDSVANENIQKNISLLEQQFHAERREKELLERNLQIQQKDILLRSKNLWIYILGSILLLLIALGYAVYKYLQQKQTVALNKQKLHELQTVITVKEEERSRIAAELHDEIGSTLSGVSLYTSLALQQLENNNHDQSKNSLSKISNNVQDTLSRLKDIVWELRPHTETIESIQQRIKTYCKEITKPAGIDAHFDFNNNGMEKQFDQEILKHVYLISKEAVNNAVKYAACNNIFVNMVVDDNTLSMHVKDDGKGFDDTIAVEGNGLRNMKKRAGDIKAQLTIRSSAEGTIVSLIKNFTQLG